MARLLRALVAASLGETYLMINKPTLPLHLPAAMAAVGWHRRNPRRTIGIGRGGGWEAASRARDPSIPQRPIRTQLDDVVIVCTWSDMATKHALGMMREAED